MAKSLKVLRKVEVTKEIIDCVTLLSIGGTVGSISNTLGLNKRTLEMKLAEVKKQFGLKSSNHMVAFFLRNKLIK